MTRRSKPPAPKPTDDDLLLGAIEEAQRSRADLAVSVAIDGLALVDSRTVADASHEVAVMEVGGERLAVRCSCWLWKRGHPCPHWAYVSIRVWEEDFGADLSEVGARALLVTLRNRLLSIPRREREKDWLQPSTGPTCPEQRFAGTEPKGALV